MNKQKRGYFVQEDDAEYGVGVVALTAKEAIKIAYNYGDLGCDYIEIRARWKKDADVEDLPIGVIEDTMLGLRRGLYSFIEEYKCDLCGLDGIIEMYNGKAICRSCIEKEEHKAED